MYGGLWLGAQMVDVPLDMGRMAMVTFNVVPVLIFRAGLHGADGGPCCDGGGGRWRSRRPSWWRVSCWTRWPASLARGLSQTLRAFSFFSYYDPGGIVQNGLNQGKTALVSALAALLALGTLLAFQRRDVGL